ncbi:MCP four helix bundle domain-containing protein [Paenibacillus sp. P25]|nr:MCP four helix bundle domain-containing protein [Paenibacillus sp. P25]
MRFSLRAKMMVVFGAVSLMVGLIGGLAFTYLTKMERSYNELLRVNAAIVQSASGIGETAQQQSAMLYSYLLAPGQDKEEKLAGINKRLTASAQALKSMAVREQDQNAAAKIAEANETFQRLLDKVADYIRRGEPDLARKEAELWSAPLTESMGTMADELAAGQKALMEEQMAQNAQRVSDIKLFVITASLAALLIALSLGLLLSRMIARPIREAAAAARRLQAAI